MQPHAYLGRRRGGRAVACWEWVRGPAARRGPGVRGWRALPFNASLRPKKKNTVGGRPPPAAVLASERVRRWARSRHRPPHSQLPATRASVTQPRPCRPGTHPRTTRPLSGTFPQPPPEWRAWASCAPSPPQKGCEPPAPSFFFPPPPPPNCLSDTGAPAPPGPGTVDPGCDRPRECGARPHTTRCEVGRGPWAGPRARASPPLRRPPQPPLAPSPSLPSLPVPHPSVRAAMSA